MLNKRIVLAVEIFKFSLIFDEWRTDEIPRAETQRGDFNPTARFSAERAS